MLKNYVRIAWRNMAKYKFHSLVNIIGLAAGIAFTLIIGAYVWNELRVNSTLKNVQQQYIIQSKWRDPNQSYELTTLGPLAKALKENYPHLVANYYRWDGISSNVSRGDKIFRESLQICDSTMLNMYGFSLQHGNAQTAFKDPFSVVLSAEKAIKFFGKTDVVGETITIENFSVSKHDFMVSGVLQKPVKNSVTWVNEMNDNQIYIPAENLSYFGRNMDWPNTYIVGYIELQKGISPAELEQPMKLLVKKNAPANIAENLSPYLVPLTSYYLNADKGLIKKTLFALSGIALFILLMAMVNFINLSVSKSGSRMREIGVRKVLGGLKRHLVLQFLVESILVVLFATLVAVLIYIVSRNLFSNILGKPVPALSKFPLYFILIPGAFVIAVGCLAGIYPSFVLSSLKTVESLKGKVTSVKENVMLRKSLTGFQFATATIVFICAYIITAQMNLFFKKDLGYNKDFIVSAQLPRDWSQAGVSKMETIRSQFEKLPQVSNVTLSYEVPNDNNAGQVALYRMGKDSLNIAASQQFTTDEFYRSTFGIPMAAGEFFGKEGTTIDSRKIVINETQSKALGWNDPQQAIGQELIFKGFGGYRATVAGVVKDFNTGTLQKAIPPVVFIHVKVNTIFRFLSFKVRPGNISESINEIRKKWTTLLPGTAFDYNFMDDNLKKLYTSEIQLKKASYTAGVFALLIVLLGVLGLISLSVEKRVKEIGIRKILGSSVSGIISLFVKEFLTVMAVASLIACPLAYILMKNWLNEYAYRIDITPEPFVASLIFIGLLTGLIIIVRTYSAAVSNPVKSLRSE